MGQVDCATLATAICVKYKPKLLVMTGVCAGRIKNDIQKGHIVIPMEIKDYQTGKLQNGQYITYGYVAKIDSDTFKPRINLWGEEIIRNIEDNSTRDKDKIKALKVHTDNQACGSLVLRTDGALENIAQNLDDKIIAVDMESYSIARTCERNEFSYTKALIIKSVMDFADINKTDFEGNFNWKEFAAYISANFSYFFIKKLESDGFFDPK